MLNEEELKDAALLVFANKQDQPGATGAGQISEALRLGELRDRNWSIMACSAVDGSGVSEGMDWLVVSIPPSLTDTLSSVVLLEFAFAVTNVPCLFHSKPSTRSKKHHRGGRRYSHTSHPTTLCTIHEMTTKTTTNPHPNPLLVSVPGGWRPWM